MRRRKGAKLLFCSSDQIKPAASHATSVAVVRPVSRRLQPAEWRSCHNITHVVSLVQVSHP
jgi:hypothetical protein